MVLFVITKSSKFSTLLLLPPRFLGSISTRAVNRKSNHNQADDRNGGSGGGVALISKTQRTSSMRIPSRARNLARADQEKISFLRPAPPSFLATAFYLRNERKKERHDDWEEEKSEKYVVYTRHQLLRPSIRSFVRSFVRSDGPFHPRAREKKVREKKRGK